MNAKMLTTILVVINVVWLATAVVANGIATNNYMKQVLQDEQAYAIPHAFKNVTGHQNVLNTIIDMLGQKFYSNSTQEDSQKVKLPIRMIAPLAGVAL